MVNQSGQHFTLDLTLVRGQGCTGHVSLGTKGSFVLVQIGTSTWIKPDSQFWKTYGGNNQAVLQLLSGKYLKANTASFGRQFGTLCDASKLASGLGTMQHLAKGPGTTVNGQPALDLTKTGAGSMDVSVSATPEILRITGAGTSTGRIDFTGYGHPVTLHTPPAGQTIDGSKLGL